MCRIETLKAYVVPQFFKMTTKHKEKILTVYRSDFIFTGWVEQVTFELTTADGR